MTEQLPLFPLSLVAFPQEKLNLHIFEPRYKQLVKDCFEAEITFGITPIDDGHPMDIGTEMKIVEISNVYPDGKMDIKTEGLRPFKVLDFYSKMNGKLYPGAEVEIIEDIPSSASILEFQNVMVLVEKLYQLLEVKAALPEWDENWSIYQIAHKLGLNFDQEIQLLKIRDEAERLDFVKSHLTHILPVITEMNQLKTKVKMNGHFKKIYPPGQDNS